MNHFTPSLFFAAFSSPTMKLVQMHLVFTMVLILALVEAKVELNKLHICDKLSLLAKNPRDVNNSLLLQSLTLNSTAGELWLIESGNLYRIPAANLDASTDRLLLYHRSSGQRLNPEKKISRVAPVLTNSVVLESDIVSMSIVREHYYFVQAPNTYYVFQDDGGNWCDSYDDKLMPWQLTAMRHPTRADGGELWVGLKQTLEERPASRRVIFTPLEMKKVRSYQNSEGVGGGEVTCNIVEFNFPGEDMGDFKPVHPKGPHVFLETVADRSTATFIPAEQSSKTSYMGDLFALPPVVLVSHSKLYMFSLEIERVYVVDADNLADALEKKMQKSFKVRSMSWGRFFSCGPDGGLIGKPGQTPPDDREPTQKEYLDMVGEIYREEPIRYDWWLEDYAEELIIAVLVVIIFITLLLVALNRGWLPPALVKCLCCGSDRRANSYMASVRARRSRRQESRKPSGQRSNWGVAKSSAADSSERKFQSEVKRMLQIDVSDNGLSAQPPNGGNENSHSSSTTPKRLAPKSTSSRSSDSSSSQKSTSGSKKIKVPPRVENTQREPQEGSKTAKPKLTDEELIMKWRKLAAESDARVAAAAAAAVTSPTSPTSPATDSPTK